MVERHHDNAEAVLFFALPWYSYWAALQYWNEFKVSIGFVSLSRTPERNENLKIKLSAAQTGLQSTKDGVSFS